MLSSLFSFRLFDPDDGFEEGALALRFDPGAERINEGEVTSSPGVRDVGGEGDAPAEFNVNGA